jgi:hypothetical protein
MAEVFKCRFCSYAVLKFATRKDGKIISGWGKLYNHIEMSHPSEAEDMETRLGPVEPWDSE